MDLPEPKRQVFLSTIVLFNHKKTEGHDKISQKGFDLLKAISNVHTKAFI